MIVDPTVFEEVSLSDLARIRQNIEQSAIAIGGDPDAVGELIVAMSEALANIINHGYQGHCCRIELALLRGGSDLLVRIWDNAPLFNPLSVPEPDTSLPLSQRPIGGMGVHLMRNFADEISYRVTPEGKNELTLCKKQALLNPQLGEN